MAPTVWTARRKWLGNLIPALFWSPLAIAGVIVMAKRGEALGLGLWLLIAATVVGWVALNAFGLFENARMRAQLDRILRAKGERFDENSPFVGFATPRYSSALDAHEDVGFLVIEPERVRFISESRAVDVPRSAVKQVRFRPNVHSLLLLGRWVSVEGELDGRPIRLLVEPRIRRTLLGNRRASRQLRERLQAWAPPPFPSQSPSSG